MSWTDERIELLTKLWAEGKSASDIAKELGDVTRNAVIGKVHRLGLKGRVNPKETPAPAPSAEPKPKAKPKVADKKVAKPEPEITKAPIAEPEIEEDDLDDQDTPPVVPAANDEIPLEAREKATQVENESKRLNLMQLTERVCKWPIGDPATEEFWFCGHPSQPGKPYCEAHVELAFQAPMARRSR